MLVYDVTKKSTFNIVVDWLDHFGQWKDSDKIVKMLVGNKIDITDLGDKEVSFEQGLELAKAHNMYFMEISGKEGINVNEAFELLVKTYDISRLTVKNKPKCIIY